VFLVFNSNQNQFNYHLLFSFFQSEGLAIKNFLQLETNSSPKTILKQISYEFFNNLGIKIVYQSEILCLLITSFGVGLFFSDKI
jgi:hypothetical protein